MLEIKDLHASINGEGAAGHHRLLHEIKKS